MPGIQNRSVQSSMFTSTNTGFEGELSYHARLWEGGCSAFILPENGDIYLIDEGRIVKG